MTERKAELVAGGTARRVVAPTLAWAVVSSATTAAVNLATEWKSNPWAWLAVGVTTVLVASAALWLNRQAVEAGEVSRGGQSVSHSVVGGDNIQIGLSRDVNLERRSDPKK